MRRTRSLERVAAAMGKLASAPTEFQTAYDVPQGGVLLALPALLAEGLLRYSPQMYHLPDGFYGIDSIFLLLAFMALARIRSMEQLRYQAPGEWGKVLGLDRIPEVRTLRQKLGLLCRDLGQAMKWNAQLAKEWIARQAKIANCIFTAMAMCGSITETRRPCRATMSPASGCACGRRPITGSMRWMASHFSTSIRKSTRIDRHTPAGCDSVVGNIGAQEWRTGAAARWRSPRPLVHGGHRSGRLQSGLVQSVVPKANCLLTYHKFPKDDWSAEEFSSHSVTLAGGEAVTMKLAERGSRLSNNLWVREIRRLTDSGHQTSNADD